MTSADLVVLGAGPAGLAAAWRAARRGLSVTVLERAGRVGGMAGSFEVAGVRVDHGSHRLHPATPPALLDELRGLLGDDLQLRPRNGRLRLAGRWVGFPLRFGELARALPRATLARAAADAVAAPLRRPRADTYAEVLRAGLGPTLYESMYAPYAVKLWGLSGEDIDGDQARKRVTADTAWKVARRVLSRPSDGQGRVFYYPRRGFGQIVEALADAAVAAGADLRLGATVTEVAADGVHVDSGDLVEAGHVFSTIPLPVLARVSRPAPPPEALADSERLRFRAMVLVYAVHEGGRWTGFDAHYLPGPETPVTRVSEPANYRVSADDPADRSVLCFEIPCAPGDATWTAGDEELGALVRDMAARHGLPKVQLGGLEVRRLPHVYPVYERGYRAFLERLDRWAAGLDGVTTFGRLGLFAHDNTHHAMTMGFDAADAMGPSGFDATAWSRARERFATHVVED
jgi:protoporphyrinogen oxidase